MATTTTTPFAAPTPTEIRDNILRTTRNGLIARGIANPNVSEKSDHWVRATALANELAPVFSNQQIRCDQLMPDTALDADLGRILAIFGDSFQPAGGSSGNIVHSASASGLVSVGTQLIDSSGNVFEVAIGGIYANGATIPVQAVDVGESTNHLAGDVLQWVSPPAYAAATVLVATGGLTNGTNADTNESARERLYAHLQNPRQAGNPAQIIDWAAEASTAVAAAYSYPALDGPATEGLCVVGQLTYDSTAGFSRSLSATVVSTVEAYVNAQLSPRTLLTCETATDVDADISIGLALPDAAAAGGPGGGWWDANPWPILNGASTRVYVSSVTSTTQFTLTSDEASTTPSATNLVDGVTQISWFSPVEWYAGRAAVQTSTVVSHSGTTGALVVVVDKPFIGIKAGDYVFPGCENAETYAQALMTSLASLGPGQWTADPNRLTQGRALRRPYTNKSNPSDLTATVIRAITDSGEEVSDGAFLYRSVTTPGVPATTASPPNILVPRSIGFYNSIP